MHEVQGEKEEDPKPVVTHPGAHAEIMDKVAPKNKIKSPPTSKSSAQDESKEMKSTSLLYKVDKSALYPSNFKPFPSRNANRRKVVSGK